MGKRSRRRVTPGVKKQSREAQIQREILEAAQRKEDPLRTVVQVERDFHLDRETARKAVARGRVRLWSLELRS